MARTSARGGFSGRRSLRSAQNPVVHFEIQSNQPKELQEFYSKLFDWKIDANNPMSYGIVDTESEGISGGIGPAMGSNRVTFYAQVEDLQKTLDSVESMGGKTLMPPTDIPDMVTFALFSDPEGNVSSENAEVFAREMIEMNDLQRKQLEKTATNNPNANAEEVLETARRQPRQKRITVVIGTETHDALEKFATDEGAEANDAAATLIEGSLSEKGYL